MYIKHIASKPLFEALHHAKTHDEWVKACEATIDVQYTTKKEQGDRSVNKSFKAFAMQDESIAAAIKLLDGFMPTGKSTKCATLRGEDTGRTRETGVSPSFHVDVNVHGLCCVYKFQVKKTDTVGDLLGTVWNSNCSEKSVLCVRKHSPPIQPLLFELFISPTMKRLDRTRSIGSYEIQEGATIYLLPVNAPKEFEPLEDSIRKIWMMEHQQMILDGLEVCVR
jgi:hypothetical protein